MQTQNNATFSVVIPLFNEEENIDPLVETIFKSVDSDPRFLEIVLVDDGSVDSTAALASNLAASDKRIRLVQHDRNRGLGAAICTGLNAAAGDFVLYTDADLPFDFETIPHLVSLAGENRVVTGYRLNRGEGPRRWVLTKTYNFLIWLFFGLYSRDVNFACKIFPKEFLQKADFKSDGSFIDVEILLETRRQGLEILEYPLMYYPRERGLSTLSRPIVILFILKEMFTYAADRLAGKRALLSFIKESPLAKFGVFLVTALVSVVLMLKGFHVSQEVEWLSLTVAFSTASILFGWRAGLVAAAVIVAGFESWMLSHSQTFLSPQNYQFLVWTFVGVILAQLSSGGWKLAQRFLKLNASEWVKN